MQYVEVGDDSAWGGQLQPAKAELKERKETDTYETRRGGTQRTADGDCTRIEFDEVQLEAQ